MKQFTKEYGEDRHGYDVTDAYSANSFLNTVKLVFGHCDMQEIKNSFSSTRDYFKSIVDSREIQTKKYNEYNRIKDIEKRLARWRTKEDYKKIQNCIDEIYKMLYANGCDMHNAIVSHDSSDMYKETYQKYTEVIMLLADIRADLLLNKQGWKDKSFAQICNEISNRVEAMHHLCSTLNGVDRSYSPMKINNRSSTSIYGNYQNDINY